MSSGIRRSFFIILFFFSASVASAEYNIGVVNPDLDSEYQQVISNGYVAWGEKASTTPGAHNTNWDISVKKIGTNDTRLANKNKDIIWGELTSIKIDNGQVVWAQSDGVDKEVYFYDYNSDTTIQITNDSDPVYKDDMPDIHNGIVVWTRYDGGDQEIYTWDYNGTRTMTPITNDAGSSFYSNYFYKDLRPSIHNGIVVWLRVSQVYMYDLNNPTEIAVNNPSQTGRVSVGNSTNYNPVIHNGVIVYEKYEGRNKDIYLYDTNAQNPQEVAVLDDDNNVGNLHDVNPKINNGIIVWERSNSSGYKAVFSYDLNNPSTPPASVSGDYKDLGNNYPMHVFRNYSYDVNNGVIVWHDRTGPVSWYATVYDIFMNSASTGTVKLTNNPYGTSNPSVDSQGNILWFGWDERQSPYYSWRTDVYEEIFVAVPSLGAGTTVCASGCDYSSIQTALDNAINGGTVLVQGGTYKGHVALPYYDINGATFDSITIKGGYDSSFTEENRDFYLNPSIIDGGSLNPSSTPSYPDYVVLLSTETHVPGNIVFDGFTVTGGGGGVFYYAPNHDSVATVTVSNTTITGLIGSRYGEGAILLNSMETIIRGNTISDNYFTGNYTNASAIHLEESDNAVIDNNRISMNVFTSPIINLYSSVSSASITNNVLLYNDYMNNEFGSGEIAYATTIVTFSNNNLYGNIAK